LTATLALALEALKYISLIKIFDEFEMKLNQFGGFLIVSPVILESCSPSVPKSIGRAMVLLVAQAAHQASPNPKVLFSSKLTIPLAYLFRGEVTVDNTSSTSVDIYVATTESPE